MCTVLDLIARVARARLSYAENLVSGDLLGACGVRVCSVLSCVRGARRCDVGARREFGQRHAYGEAVPVAAHL